jgi:hypothetical protein
VGLIDQLIGGHFTPRTHFRTTDWCSKLALRGAQFPSKSQQNEVITFERLKIGLNSSMGPVGLGQRPGKSLRLASKTNPIGVLFFYGPGSFFLKPAKGVLT